MERPLAGDPRALQRSLDAPPLVADLLCRRGITADDAGRAFLGARLADLPDPSELTDLDRAAERLARACRTGQRVHVHGDYDVDGVASTALLVDVLRRLGLDVRATLPHRVRDGYGISAEAVDDLAAAGTDLLVTTDCGVGAHDALERARERGIDVVVLDHHVPGSSLPPATAIVDPARDGAGGVHGPLCATGVVFLVLAGLRRHLRAQGFFGGREEPNLADYLDLVALATVADMVPLVGTNRLLVRHGLRVLTRRRRAGLAALLETSGVSPTEPVDAATCAFRLAPRINAAGRLDDPGRALDLLLARDPGQARPLARDLDRINARRRELEQRIVGEARAMIGPGGLSEARRGLALLGDGWHVGVLGIVASRLVREVHRPVLVATVDGGRVTASVRSIPGVDLIPALESLGDLLQRSGGHAAAAGLALRRDDFDALRHRFETEVFADLPAERWVPTLEHDGPLDLARVDEGLMAQIDGLAPFGVGNPEPLFVARDAEVRGLRVVGRGALQLRVGPAPGHAAICFRPPLIPAELGRRIDLLFTPTRHVYRGQRSIQLRIEDLKNA